MFWEARNRAINRSGGSRLPPCDDFLDSWKPVNMAKLAGVAFFASQVFTSKLGFMRATLWACILIVMPAAGGCGRPAGTPATPTSSSPQNSFSYDKQVGIVGSADGNIGCLAIFNDSLPPGTKVVLADPAFPHTTGDKPAVREATIVERVPKWCDQHLISTLNSEGKQESYYRIQAPGPEWQGSGYQVVIIDPKLPLSVQDGKVTGDVDGDGTPESFRMCFSNEGAHYQVWTGAPLEGRGRWHWYVYAGYDLEYDCTDKDYFGPG
jgi:hypothetical protein